MKKDTFVLSLSNEDMLKIGREAKREAKEKYGVESEKLTGSHIETCLPDLVERFFKDRNGIDSLVGVTVECEGFLPSIKGVLEEGVERPPTEDEIMIGVCSKILNKLGY